MNQRRKLTKDERMAVYEKTNGHCAYCGCELEYKDMQVDHVIPINGWSEQGEDTLDNMLPACRSCNHYKSRSTLEGFRKMVENMKKFEAEREQFYLDFLDICHSFDPFRFKFYKRLFLESFHPKYRSQKKLYDGYYGGWWRDSDGRPCANPIQLIDIDSVSDGEICIERDDSCIYAVYLKKDDCLIKIDPQIMWQ